MTTNLDLYAEYWQQTSQGQRYWANWPMEDLFGLLDAFQNAGSPAPDELLSILSMERGKTLPDGWKLSYINYKGRIRAIVQKGHSNRTFE